MTPMPRSYYARRRSRRRLRKAAEFTALLALCAAVYVWLWIAQAMEGM